MNHFSLHDQHVEIFERWLYPLEYAKRMSTSTEKTEITIAQDRHSTTLTNETEIIINVYDVVPPGKIPSLLCHAGVPIIYTAVLIKRWNREFSFAGHKLPTYTGVYSTPARRPPPDRYFRCELHQGWTSRTDDELYSVLDEAARKFQGSSYNAFDCNCNHFTHYLCTVLTNMIPPAWLNRAAGVAHALRFMIPRSYRILIDHLGHTNGEREILEEVEGDDGQVLLWHCSTLRYGQLLDGFHDASQVDVCTKLSSDDRAPLVVRHE